VVSTVPLPQPTATDGAVANRTPLRIGGDVQGGPLQYAPKPAFPDSARLMGIEGTVVLSAIIGADGHVKDVRVVSTTDSAFSDPALQAIQNWVYKKTLLNNQATEIVNTITVNFRLQSR
jgi:TonB family protein